MPTAIQLIHDVEMTSGLGRGWTMKFPAMPANPEARVAETRNRRFMPMTRSVLFCSAVSVSSERREAIKRITNRVPSVRTRNAAPNAAAKT